jgi:gas vesicle protein
LSNAQEADKKNGSLFIKGLVAGVVVGGVATWLFAPYSGAQLQAMLREQLLTLRHQTSDLMVRFEDDAREQIAKTRTTIRLLRPDKPQQ